MNRRKKFYWLALGLPFLLWLPALSGFPYRPGASYSDFTISHYPNALYIQQSIRTFGHIPLWSDRILSGYPFAADPLSGLWYLPAWLAYLLPLPAGLNLLVLLHLLLAGAGTTWLLRKEGVGWPAALLGGLLFELLPKFTAHFAAGHITLLMAVAWTPWLLLVERVNVRRGWQRAAAGLILGMILLADARWAPYAGLLWAVDVWRSSGYRERRWKNYLRYVVVQVGTALLVAAPLLVPLMEYVRLSTRSALTAQDRLVFSLPVTRLWGLLTPDLHGLAEWVAYPGCTAVFLLLWVLWQPRLRRAHRFWLLVVAGAVLVSLGQAIPGMSWLVSLPGLSLLRVPPRALFLAGFAFAMLAGFALDAMLKPAGMQKQEGHLDPLFWITGITTFLLLFAAAAGAATGKLPVNFLWGAVGLALMVVLVWLCRGAIISTRTWMGLVFLLAMVDGGALQYWMLEFRPAQEVLAEGSAAVRYVASQPEAARAFSLTYSLPQHTAAWYQLEQASGVDPMQLSAYALFAGRAAGVPANGYQVTVPAFDQEDPQRSNATAQPDAERLGWLSVEYLVSEYPLPEGDWLLRARFGDTRVYQNVKARPRVWVQTEADEVGPIVRSATLLRRHPNEVRAAAQGPGWLVFSELAYPGWQAYLDDQRIPLRTTAGLFRAVYLPDGVHTVRLIFRPVAVWVGLGLALLGWLGLAYLTWRETKWK